MDWKRCWCASRSWALAVAAVQICSSFFTVVVTAHALVQGVPVSPGIEGESITHLDARSCDIAGHHRCGFASWSVEKSPMDDPGVDVCHRWRGPVAYFGWTEVSRRLIPDPSSVAQRGSVAVVEDQIIW
ncbi:unnamed protein product [Allacma fusca]|uniref:Uncharacterized protein n=1 Tax=Allacma fusca TaxID=39272 RepID=A0A8J2K6L0_9HEXA|nr:unnamed protein product [Allacma fusca]